MLNNIGLAAGGSGAILLIFIDLFVFMCHKWTAEDTLRLIFAIMGAICMFLTDLVSGRLF